MRDRDTQRRLKGENELSGICHDFTHLAGDKVMNVNDSHDSMYSMYRMQVQCEERFCPHRVPLPAGGGGCTFSLKVSY